MPPPASASASGVPLATPAQVVTFTVYAPGASASPSPPPLVNASGSSVPIGAIVGGVVGGVALSLIAVLGWWYWGNRIERAEAKARKEQTEHLKVRENTRRNASSGFSPRVHYQPKLTVDPDGRKVKFLPRTGAATAATPAPAPPPSEKDGVLTAEKGKQRADVADGYMDEEKFDPDEVHDEGISVTPPPSPPPIAPLPVLTRHAKPPAPSPLSAPPISAPPPDSPPPVLPRAKSPASQPPPPPPPPPRRGSWVLPSDTPPIMPRAKSTSSASRPPPVTTQRRTSTHSVLSTQPLSRETRARMGMPAPAAPLPLAHKPSGVSTVDSTYSRDSGEPRAPRDSVSRRFLGAVGLGANRLSTHTKSTGSFYSDTNE
ncbi:hypothetical protein FA95DRAFT_816282 [Auriscalpium vulgare]|uniref:Uncharacterized protein n=1 Tax=Auriscalpium vulgare TaxID=40419 RepID=A0ACB8S1D9_9AGAM|nr:hypothetical protein FA95DRAFT_816282 [Auriscalpium vulgare]